eukprot:7748613-Alexandrium_andersonii.AAC.1
MLRTATNNLFMSFEALQGYSALSGPQLNLNAQCPHLQWSNKPAAGPGSPTGNARIKLRKRCSDSEISGLVFFGLSKSNAPWPNKSRNVKQQITMSAFCERYQHAAQRSANTPDDR